jgi:transcriptional regulator of acetoin/glycerol metabolism
MESLVNFDWPGNVRQLKNVVERLVILSDEGVLGLLNLMDELRSKRSTHSSRIPETQAALLARKKEILAQHFLPLQKAFLIKALKESEGNISKAARKVGLKRPNFYSLLKDHNISAESFRSGSGQSQSK